MTDIEYQDAVDVASIKMHDSDELAYVINRNKTIKDTTKKQYRTAYKKWQSTTERQVIDCSEQSIIDILEKVACAPNTKNNVVSVIVLITLSVSLIEALIILPSHIAHSKTLQKGTKPFKFNFINS